MLQDKHTENGLQVDEHPQLSFQIAVEFLSQFSIAWNEVTLG